MTENNSYGFDKAEWENCIKVLSALKDDPFNNPDNKLFGTLLTKIYKNAKKTNRVESHTAKRKNDLKISLSAGISANAVKGKSLFWDEESGEEPQFSKLQIPKNCYCCNHSYELAHSFYSRLCPDCARENYAKRFENIDLQGRKVILTGGRVKIGYATALRLLRNNATVVLTTRFPALALKQLQEESDYEQWKDKLFVYGLDLRNLNAINDFVNYYKSNFTSLDIIINNAAQTIKYPADYYLPMIAAEEQLLKVHHSAQNLIENKTPLAHQVKQLEYGQDEFTGISLNRFGQPVDSRDKTSWNSTLEEISMQELIEVNLINQIAPYFLIKELKPLFLKSGFNEKFIINVTSSEGIFSYDNKTKYHPHTNMTKAALNMMTLTSAKEFAEENIYMTCVDVGWISTGAKESLRKKQFEKGYIPPLDSVDGASRILHPIVKGINKEYYYGVLLKNYKVSQW